uniref:hypothetical protein n=1 Tax=uncultured Draconibacterium sp. TaxID=1573823 RepID=UPI00321666ED
MYTKLNCKAFTKVTLLIIAILSTISCSDKDDPIGLWDDNIQLSKKDVVFTSKTDSVTITTKGSWWWIDNISFQDSTYSYYGRDDINLESGSYYITEDDFIVERRDKNTLFIKLNQNNTGKKRNMDITVEAGNYFDHIFIEQAAE